MSQHLPVTPFGKLQAESQISGVKAFEQVQMDVPTITDVRFNYYIYFLCF